jgi:hypothetical protein
MEGVSEMLIAEMAKAAIGKGLSKFRLFPNALPRRNFTPQFSCNKLVNAGAENGV